MSRLTAKVFSRVAVLAGAAGTLRSSPEPDSAPGRAGLSLLRRMMRTLLASLLVLLAAGAMAAGPAGEDLQPGVEPPPPPGSRGLVPNLSSPEERKARIRERGERIKQEKEREKLQRLQPQGAVERPSFLSSIGNWLVSTAEAAQPFVAGQVTATSPEITELAHSLKDDPELIFKYVYDNIHSELTFGSRKGGLGALLDQSGNDIDQADLLVQLLRVALPTATVEYQFGTVSLPPTAFTDWLSQSNLTKAQWYLLFPGNIVYADPTNLKFDHVWVKVTIGGTSYVLDPSIKKYAVVSGVDLATATGFTESTFTSNALSGSSTSDAYSRKNYNKANISSGLATASGNLVSYIRTNHPAKSFSEIVGGRDIVPFAGTWAPPTTHPYVVGSVTSTTSIPTAYLTRLKVEIGNTDASQHIGTVSFTQTFDSSALYGHRLTFTFDSSNKATLKLDGVTQATSAAGITGTVATVRFTIDDPAFSDVVHEQALQMATSKQYLVANSWGEVRASGVLDKRRKWLDEYRDQGIADTDERVMGETLALLAANWIAQSDRTSRIVNQINGAQSPTAVRLGIAGQTTAPYVDLPINLFATTGWPGMSSADETALKTSIFTEGGVSSGLEHGVLEQTQELNAVSTVKLLSLANDAADDIYLLNSANATAVKAILTLPANGYTDTELTNYLNAGLAVSSTASVVVPKHRNITVDSYQGNTGLIFAETAANANGIVNWMWSYLIGPGLSGGNVSVPATISPIKTAAATPAPLPSRVLDTIVKGLDPVELSRGNYTASTDDMSVGAGAFPFGLSMQRTYDGGDRLAKGAFGYGWRHNLELKANVVSNAEQGLGRDSAVDAAPTIAAAYAISKVLAVARDRDRMVIAALAQTWLVDQLKKNAVDVNTGGASQLFVKLPDGSFNPPPGSADVLTALSGGSGYTLKQKAGPTMTFDSAGRITQWQQPGGGTSDNKLTFSYDAGNGNRLQSVSSTYGRTLTLSYDGAGGTARINGVSDGNGRSVSYAYDGSGNLSIFTNALGQASTYQYDTRHRLTKSFSPEYPTSAYVENIYDDLDRVKEQINALGKHSYTKIAGTRAEEIDPLGNSKVFTFDDAGRTLSETDGVGRTTMMLYDGQGRLTERTAPEGNKVKYEYDANHNVTKITQVAKPGCTGSCSDIVQQFVYELNSALGHYNKLKQSTDASGRVTDLAYFTGTPNLQKVQQPALSGSGGVRPETNFTYTSKGQLDTETDAEGRVTKHAYAASTGLETSVTRDYGTGRLNLITAQTYDAVGNVASVTDPLSHTTTFTYDAERHRVTSTAPSPFIYLTTFLYDKNGRLFETRAATGNSAQPEQVATTVHSASDKPLYTIDADGNATAFAYDDADRLIQTTDAEGRVSQQTYTADNRPYETKQVISGTPTTIKTATYTTNGQLYSLKDANNNTTTYAYDGFDRLNKVTYPNTKFETIAYNPTGTVSQRVTRNNETTTYAYDELDRQTSEDPPGASDVIATTYDKTGRVDLVKVNGTTVFDHDYDTAGRQTQVTRSGDSKVLVTTLDAAGNRTALTYPGTPTYTVDYSYDELGRPKQVKENGTTVLATWTYTDRLNGSVTYADTSTETVKTTLTGELAQLTQAFNGETVQFSLFQNRTGQLINQRISLTAFDYAPPGTASHSYTPNTMNQFSSVDSVSQSYDNNGNLTGDGTWTFGFDYANRLISATKSGTSATYQYDAFGRREQKTVNSTVTKYLSDGPSVVEEYDGSGTRTARYAYLPGIDRPLFMERSSTRYYYHQDGQGSVVALTGTNGVVSERYTYSPYGESASTSAAGNPYRYTGRELDAETGLYYYRARYYSTTLGRFLSPDPLGYEDSMGLYAYVANDPLNLNDPLGLYAKETASKLRSLLPAPVTPSFAERNEYDELQFARNAFSGVSITAARVQQFGASGLGGKVEGSISTMGESSFAGIGRVTGHSTSLTVDLDVPIQLVPNSWTAALEEAHNNSSFSGVAKISRTIGMSTRGVPLGVKAAASISSMGQIDFKIGAGYVNGSSGTFPVYGIKGSTHP